MNERELVNAINDPAAVVLSHPVLLYQRNLGSEASSWLRQVEAKAKQTKKGKIVLIAVLKED